MEKHAFELMSAERKPVALAMQNLWLEGRVLPMGALLRVRHDFRVGGHKNVEAVYCFGLPRDAALRRFILKTGSLTAHSELRDAGEAARAYEKGLAAGSLAALASQYGDGLVNLSVGNIRPDEEVSVELEIVAGVELRDGGLRLRFPFTLAPSYHRDAIAVSPEPGWGQMDLPESVFGDLLLPEWVKDARGLHKVGFDLRLEMGREVERVGSPSHRIQVERGRVALAAAGDLPDRDLVLEVESGAEARVVSGGRRIAVVVPSVEFGKANGGERTVVLLIDRSGSMAGAPFEQAKSAALACVAALEPEDRFGIALFSSGTEVWKSKLAPATKANREDAARFLAASDVGGGTELGEAIEAVARLMGDSGGEVLLLTDGEVFGGEDLLRTARATRMRLHALGIGSASQDRMLSLLARETGGVSRYVTARERVDQAALEMFASAGRPVATGLRAEVKGVVTVNPPERVYSGSPISLFARLNEGAAAAVRVRWEGGEREFTGQDGTEETGEALRLLEGARRITEIDCRWGAGSNARENRRIQNALRQLSEEYGLASRAMALVAVIERSDDIAGDVPRTLVVPVGLPEDMLMEGVFKGSVLAAVPSSPPSKHVTFSLAQSFGHLMTREAEAAPSAPPDPVIELATMIEDDGGMPGADMEERIENSFAARQVFIAAGDAFSAHARRLERFLSRQKLSESDSARLQAATSAMLAGKATEEAAEVLLTRIRANSGGGRR